MDTQEKIEKEYRRIYEYFKDLPENQLAVALPLIQNFSFMKVTLEDLQASINENGVSEEYQNGANQHGKKASSELQAYNALMKNFTTVQKQLSQLLPEMKTEELSSLDALRASYGLPRADKKKVGAV